MAREQNYFEKVVRPWGYFVNIAYGENYLTKIIHVNLNGQLSLQSHNHRSEHWFVLKGNAKVHLKGKSFVLKQGESIDIPVNAKHSLANPFKADLEIIEIQTGDYLSEDDIIRYEDIYGRV